MGLCLLTATPAAASGDFWKQAGKVLDALSGDSSKSKSQSSSSSKSSSSRSSSQNKSQTYGPLDGVQMSILSCERWGNGVRVQYKVTNSSSYDRDLRFTYKGDPCDSTQPDPIMEDNLNNSYEGGPYSLGSDVYQNVLGYLSSKVPAGVTVKGTYVVKSVAPSATSFKKLTIGGNELLSGGRTPFEYTWTNLPITERSNSDNSSVSCSLPTFYISYKGAVRDGKNVKITFTIRNDSGKDVKAWQMLNSTSKVAYSEDGDSFDVKWQVGSKANGESSDLPADVPVKCTVTVMNVPATVTAFSLIRIGLFENEYNIEFKNLKI